MANTWRKRFLLNDKKTKVEIAEILIKKSRKSLTIKQLRLLLFKVDGKTNRLFHLKTIHQIAWATSYNRRIKTLIDRNAFLTSQ
jgi:hypothetical protein